MKTDTLYHKKYHPLPKRKKHKNKIYMYYIIRTFVEYLSSQLRNY